MCTLIYDYLTSFYALKGLFDLIMRILLSLAVHFTFKYQRCSIHEYEIQDFETEEATTFFVTPGSIQYYMISPSYFFKSRVAALRVQNIFAVFKK